ncbi:MAG TPA: response regulator [Kofleriaceae bacterium]|nr:response regulator [Kofleriaceae bacterium]
MATAAAPALKDVSILVIDDDPDVLELYQRLARAAGARVVTATNVAEALDALADWKPDAIVCDLHLPGMDGYGLIERVRADARLADLPVISISASHPDIEREHSRTAGFTTHLAKPTRFSDIINTVASLVIR